MTNRFSGLTTTEALKSAYRDAAKQLHPDVGGSKEAFQQLQKEYADAVYCLSEGVDITDDDTPDYFDTFEELFGGWQDAAIRVSKPIRLYIQRLPGRDRRYCINAIACLPAFEFRASPEEEEWLSERTTQCPWEKMLYLIFLTAPEVLYFWNKRIEARPDLRKTEIRRIQDASKHYRNNGIKPLSP